MTPNDTFDESPEPFATGLMLPRLKPDAARAARVRAQCRARLVRQQERNSRTGRGTFLTHFVVPALAGGFCVLYVAVLVATTLHLYDVLL